MHKHHLPVIGIAVALCLLIGATLYYPGGTADIAHTVGYSWTHNFLSDLFAPVARNGAINPARSIAISAMLLMCASLGVVFKYISTKCRSQFGKKMIEIGGIGAMVYGFLVSVFAHNLMLNISLLFAFPAIFAILRVSPSFDSVGEVANAGIALSKA